MYCICAKCELEYCACSWETLHRTICYSSKDYYLKRKIEKMNNVHIELPGSPIPGGVTYLTNNSDWPKPKQKDSMLDIVEVQKWLLKYLETKNLGHLYVAKAILEEILKEREKNATKA